MFEVREFICLACGQPKRMHTWLTGPTTVTFIGDRGKRTLKCPGYGTQGVTSRVLDA